MPTSRRAIKQPIQVIPGRAVEWQTGPGESTNDRRIYDVARQLADTKLDAPATLPVYTVANGTTDRALDVTGDTLAQGLAVLGSLIADLKAAKIIG